MMEGVFVGIDVGGTHTDGVAVDGGRIAHKVKVPTRADDLRGCILEALGTLLEELSPSTVRRVVLSTTLVTNAVVQGNLDPTGTLLCAGPGIDPGHHAPGAHTRVVPGAVDHRGREIAPLDEAAVDEAVAGFRAAGIRSLAVVGKFSARNPGHELRIAERVGEGFDTVCLGHTLSGALNFPRRVATTYLAAGVSRRHREFVGAMTSALEEFGIDAPLYLLRADGGTQRAPSFRNPAETALSGPAASVMGVEALDRVAQETLALDIGGTTTDISLFTAGFPLLEPRGATIGAHRTQIRALFTRSTGAGGDSAVRVENDRLLVGPQRLGPPACLGGTHPTPTDALVVLGRTLGDEEPAARSLQPLARVLGITLEQAARQVLRRLAGHIADAARAFVAEVNAQPVYTIHELLEGHRVAPVRAVAVGGPARAIAPYIEEALDLPVHVPNHFDVANAVGAALARVNLEVNLIADTARGFVSVPEADLYRQVPEGYSLADAEAEALDALSTLARHKGVLDPNATPEVVEKSSFRVIQGFHAAGNIHYLRAQIRPGILGRAV
jgi:N-methylhydantoinase A/oxoprolinase/acetone carboxylase beta subunit